jgi:cytochrome c
VITRSIAVKAAGLAATILISSAMAQTGIGPWGPTRVPDELPGGWGNGVKGVFIFARKCSGCHNLDGKTSAKNMETCWHEPKALFEFVKKAMPANAPGSLENEEVYAAVAYILTEAKIIKRSDVMNAKTLPSVVMPNRNDAFPAGCGPYAR